MSSERISDAEIDNALAFLERARQAQEAHERRIDVQLRFWSVQDQLDAELADTVQAVRAEREGLQGSR